MKLLVGKFFLYRVFTNCHHNFVSSSGQFKVSRSRVFTFCIGVSDNLSQFRSRGVLALTRNRNVSLGDWSTLTVSHHYCKFDRDMFWRFSQRRGGKPYKKSYHSGQKQERQVKTP